MPDMNLRGLTNIGPDTLPDHEGIATLAHRKGALLPTTSPDTLPDHEGIATGLSFILSRPVVSGPDTLPDHEGIATRFFSGDNPPFFMAVRTPSPITRGLRRDAHRFLNQYVTASGHPPRSRGDCDFFIA